tara:strand:+ start:10493 stop:11536 length:1044 start_codon:yes stop_codon:yes gene_type:complete
MIEATILIFIVIVALVVAVTIFGVKPQRLLKEYGEKNLCPKSEKIDNKLYDFFNTHIKNIYIIRKVWNGKVAEIFKKIVLAITIAAVLTGILIEKINEWTGFDVSFIKEIAGFFLGFFLVFTYLFGLIIGFLSFSECRGYMQCDITTRLIIIFMNLAKNILLYLVPAIIVVSFLNSVYNSIGQKSTNECGTNNFNINIPEEVQNIIIYIGFTIFIIGFIYFEYLHCSKVHSLFAGFLIMFLIIIANFFLINLTINSYSNLLSANFGIKNFQYWALFVISVFVYMITFMRASEFEDFVSYIINSIIEVMPSCGGTPVGRPTNVTVSNDAKHVPVVIGTPVGGGKKKKK